VKYSTLGRSNLSVSKICLGTMHFGPYATQEDAFRIMDRALDLGVNVWDTANVYGGAGARGRSEEIIGNWFAQRQGGRVVLATKVYHSMSEAEIPNEERGISAYKVRKHVTASLRRLQTDHIDLYQVHHIDRRVAPEEFWGTFERLVADGDVLYMGSSNFPGWGLAKYQMHAWQRGSMGFVSEQTMYNLLCRAPELEVLPAAQDFGIGVMVYMSLAGGLLTGKTQATEGSRTRQVEGEYGISLGPDNQQFAAFSALCGRLARGSIAWPSRGRSIILRSRQRLSVCARSSNWTDLSVRRSWTSAPRS